MVLLRAIRESLGDMMTRYHVILLMDAHRAHISEGICRRARAYGMTLVYVPAKLTWLLQPADTHLFGQFKNHARRLYTQSRLENVDGRLQPEQWLRLVCNTIQTVVMERTWEHAFRSNGISDAQRHTSLYVRSMAGLSRDAYPVMRPSAEEIEFLFGMKRIPYNLLMPEVQAPAAPAAAHGAMRVPRGRRLPAALLPYVVGAAPP